MISFGGQKIFFRFFLPMAPLHNFFQQFLLYWIVFSYKKFAQTPVPSRSVPKYPLKNNNNNSPFIQLNAMGLLAEFYVLGQMDTGFVFCLFSFHVIQG